LKTAFGQVKTALLLCEVESFFFYVPFIFPYKSQKNTIFAARLKPIF